MQPDVFASTLQPVGFVATSPRRPSACPGAPHSPPSLQFAALFHLSSSFALPSPPPATLATPAITHLSQLQPETQDPRGKMTNIAASNDNHDRSERESERSPSLTSHQPVVPRHELEATEATEVTDVTEVTCGAWPLGPPHQKGQVTPCDQQQAPQANQAAVAATEAAAQPQALPTSDQPSESVLTSPLTSPLAAPARTPDVPAVNLQHRTASAGSAEGTRAQGAAAATPKALGRYVPDTPPGHTDPPPRCGVPPPPVVLHLPARYVPAS